MGRWLGRYGSPLPIRCRGSFHFYASEEGADRVVVVVPAEPASTAASQCLERLARAHRELHRRDAERFPEVREVGREDGTPFVVFDCDALWDGEAAIARMGELGERVPYVEAIAVVDDVAGALESAHDTSDDAGRPQALGALCWANVMIGRQGRISLFGFGHNVAALSESGHASGAPSVFLAPEVAAGGPATPSGDLYSFVVMQRLLLSYCDLPGPLARAFAGAPSDDDPAVGEVLAWANQRILTAPPAARPSLREARKQHRHEWALLGIQPDFAGLRAHLVRLLGDDDVAERDAPGDRLVIGPEAAWVRSPSGERHKVARLPLRRLLLRLLRHRRESPGQRLDVDALLEAGWPGERPIREAGLNRVYAAVSLLRNLGLREALQRNGEGYRLDPDLPVLLEDEQT